MDREEEEAVLRITADYVAEVQAGRSPRLGDYLARYPQYADAITEFVTYYHVVEVDIPGESLIMPPLSEGSAAALEHAWGRIRQPDSGRAFTGPLTALLARAGKEALSFADLAIKSGLSQDIAEKLERRMIAASTLPQELLKRFATLLQQPLSVIAACFGLSDQSQVDAPANVAAPLARARVAEVSSFYEIEQQPDVRVESFREAIEQSVQLSDEQRAAWRNILSREDL